MEVHAMIDRTADLKALARRLTEAASGAAVTAEMRKDLNAAADIVWEYIVLSEPEDPTQIAITPLGEACLEVITDMGDWE
jgi:hypothetical protein